MNPPTYPFEETSFMDDPLLEIWKIKATPDWNTANDLTYKYRLIIIYGLSKPNLV